MASVVPVSVIRWCNILCPHTKCIMLYLVFLNPHPLLFDTGTRRYDDFLAISALDLSSYMVAVVAQLGEHCRIDIT